MKNFYKYTAAFALSVAIFSMGTATTAQAAVPLGTTHCYYFVPDFGATSAFFQNDTLRMSKGRVLRYQQDGYDITHLSNGGAAGSDGICYWYPN